MNIYIDHKDPEIPTCAYCQKQSRFMESHLTRCQAYLKHKQKTNPKKTNTVKDAIQVLQQQLKPPPRRRKARVSPKSHRQQNWEEYQYSVASEREFLAHHPEPEEDSQQDEDDSPFMLRRKNTKQPRFPCPHCNKKIANLDAHRPYCRKTKKKN